MKLIVQVHRENGLAFQQDELPDVTGDTAEPADEAGEAASLGITQAALRRRMFRLWRFVRGVAERVPQHVETVLKTPEEMEAEEERRRAKKAALAEARRGEKKEEKKAAKKAAKAEEK